MTSVDELSVAEAGRLLRRGELTSQDLTANALQCIAAGDGSVHSFITVTAERAMADARRADAELAAGHDRGALHGIPYALKDVIDTAGIRTTCGSRLLMDNVPAHDAVVAARMREAGGVLLGKLMTYEFATAGPSFDLPFPASRNPRNPDHITGGSSSGCAAAVAAGFTRITVGTDGGGSNRSPACYCGVVGLKPTFGRVPLAGIQPLSPSLDHAGPIAANVEDAAFCFDAMRDPGSASAVSEVGQDIRGLRLAYARNWSATEAEPQVQRALDAAVALLARLGATIEEIDIPDYDFYEACGTVIIQAEAFGVHAKRLRTSAKCYGSKAFLNLVTGAILTADDCKTAKLWQQQLTRALDAQLFPRFDALIAANTLTTAPPVADFFGNAPRWTAMRTFPFNVTGHPALAVPIGQSPEGLPIGMQVAGRHLGEAMICRIGAAFEVAMAPRLRFGGTAAATAAQLM